MQSPCGRGLRRSWAPIAGTVLVSLSLLAQTNSTRTQESATQSAPTQAPSARPAPIPAQPQPPVQTRPGDSSASGSASAKQPSRITPEQAKQLFGSVDSILQFDSQVTGLPIRHSVQRRLVTRDEVVHYLMQQLHNGRESKRLEQNELVLKKFGLLDGDFELRPFLIQLLREQIAGYYNDKTKTVNLLDWIPPAEQKPVLAHELTHALQDQYIHLEKWSRKSELSVSKNVREDNAHIAVDEADTARDAVIEGQAMAVFVDYALAPTGKNLLTAPNLVDRMNEAMSDDSDSPTLAHAPLLLQRSLLFPYAAGLRFVRAVLTAQGKQAAFAGMLDRPPSSSYEIMTPKVYLNHSPVPLLHMPDIHPLIDAEYRPYDIGVMGEFDVQVMSELFGGTAVSNELTPAWRGGIYYTAQKKAAKTEAERDSTDSLALLYLSRWATPAAARAFAAVYAEEIPRKYDDARAQPDDEAPSEDTDTSSSQWSTSVGPVLIVVAGRTVFISESFPLELARKLQLVMMGSIQDSAGSVLVESRPKPRMELTASLRHWLLAVGAGQALFLRPTRAAEASKSARKTATQVRPDVGRCSRSIPVMAR